MNLNVFDNDAFSVHSLTEAVNRVEPTPSQLNGVFDPRPVATTEIRVERRERGLVLVPFTPRGSIGTPHRDTKGRAFYFETQKISKSDLITAKRLQNARRFGTEAELETATRLATQVQAEMSADLDATQAVLRVGALRGEVRDAATGEVVYNYFDEFGITPPSAVDLNLDAASPASGVLSKTIRAALRNGEVALKDGLTSLRGWRILTGPALWDDFIAHPEVRATYLNQQEAGQLRGALRGEFNFAGATWVECTDRVGGETIVDENEALAIPVGAGALIEALGPSDYVDLANVQGLPSYSRMEALRMGRGWELEVSRFPLPIAVIPEALIRFTRT